MPMSNIKIGVRLGATFALLIALLLTVVALALLRFSDIETMTRRSIEDDWAKSEAAATIDAMQRANAQRVMETILYTDPAQRAQSKALLAQNRQAIEASLAVLERLTMQCQKTSCAFEGALPKSSMGVTSRVFRFGAFAVEM